MELPTLSLTKFARFLLVGTIGIFLSFFVSTSVFSQTPPPEPTAGTGLNLTFPVEDLGGCNNLEECTNYCEDPINQNSCMDFAKENGFYQDDVTTYGDDEFWSDTQSELGCNSEESCETFCSQEANHEACSSFANRNEIPGGYVDTSDKPEYLEVAQNVLGCDSAQSCATFCDDAANAEACTNFANQIGLLGGTSSEGPGGCQTPESCGAYCSDPANYPQCSTHQGGSFAGPGGCNSEESCRSYCDQNPENCRSYAPGASGTYVPVECPAGEYHGPGGVCTATGDTQAAVTCVGANNYWTGDTCSETPPEGINPEQSSAHFEERPEMGNCSSPGECYDYCVANQGTCQGFDPSGTRPTDDYTPYLYYTPGSEVTNEPIASMGNCDSPASCYDWCSDNPDSCQGFSDDAPRPPEIYIPGTYYTPPQDTVYVTPPVTSFYTTPIYYTPPEGSNYTTPQYYTPGTYYTPNYYTPPSGSNYTTPNYYTPWGNYPTPTGEYPTPTYSTPTYYTPPRGSDYTTPYYYTPPPYSTPYYYTPFGGYTTPPPYLTPPPYTTPQYYTPWEGGGYTTPVYFTPPIYSTPTYYTPPAGSNYTSPSYYTPPPPYLTPTYYTPGQYPTPVSYQTPPPYTNPPS